MSASARWRKNCIGSVRNQDPEELNSLFKSSDYMHTTLQWRFELRELFDEVLALGLSGPKPQTNSYLECLEIVARHYFSKHKRLEDFGILALCTLEERTRELVILVEAGIMLKCKGNIDMERSPLHILVMSEAPIQPLRGQALVGFQGVGISDSNRVLMASTLLSHGLDPNIQSRNGNSAMHLAAMLNTTHILKVLIDWGADLDLANQGGLTALMLACAEGSTQSAELLLQAEADLDFVREHEGTPLSIAVINNHVDIVRLLLQYNCNISSNTSAYSYATAADRLVGIAAEQGHFEVCLLLLGAGCGNRNLKLCFTRERFRNKVQASGSHLMSVLESLASDVPMLKAKCRTVIRYILGRSFVTAHLFLPLPDILLDYLTLPEL